MFGERESAFFLFPFFHTVENEWGRLMLGSRSRPQHEVVTVVQHEGPLSKNVGRLNLYLFLFSFRDDWRRAMGWRGSFYFLWVKVGSRIQE